MQSSRSVPGARRENLVTTEVKEEVLVYDEERHHIHHLNQTAAAVWRLCNGQRTVSDIAQVTGIEEDAVRITLHKLDQANLLNGALATDMRGNQSRRSFMKKVGIAAVPAIVSVTAPSAAVASSHCDNPCGGFGLCACVAPGTPACIDGCCVCT